MIYTDVLVHVNRTVTQCVTPVSFFIFKLGDAGQYRVMSEPNRYFNIRRCADKCKEAGTYAVDWEKTVQMK